MADAIEKLKREIQADLPEGWRVDHAQPYAQPAALLPEQGVYRAWRRLPNGTMMTQQADTPEALVTAAREYDREHARAASTTPTVTAGTLATPARPTPVEQGADFHPQTEEELAELAIEVQPVALAEKLAVDPDDVDTTPETKAAAGLTQSGKPKKGTDASIIPPGASPEQAAAVTGVQPKKRKSTNKGK